MTQSDWWGGNLYKYAPNPVSWQDPLGWITYNTMPGIEGFQKHYIVPQQLSNHAAIQAGEVNIHKLSNIIYLPKYEENHPARTVHRGSLGSILPPLRKSWILSMIMVRRTVGVKPITRKLSME